MRAYLENASLSPARRRAVYSCTSFACALRALASSAPIGVFAIYYLVFFVAARLLSVVVYASGWSSIFALMFVMATVGRIVLPIIASGFGHGWPIWTLRNWSFLGLLLNTFMGVLLYWSLVILDKVTFKAPRINIELGEDSL